MLADILNTIYSWQGFVVASVVCLTIAICLPRP